MSRKVKNIAAVCGVVLLVLAAVYFFPQPMKSAFDAPVDENCVIHIRQKKFTSDSESPLDFERHFVECTPENGLTENALKILSNEKIVNSPKNLFPWNIKRYSGNIWFDIAIARPDNTSEWIYIGDGELFFSKEEMRFYYIERSLGNALDEFVSEYGIPE
ncbi:MAG: hypothetical protein IJF04_05890 [Oscillospiraceae bacterium]|nr:hypothetical protein [Oscillospiraceae bacterium]